MGFMDSVKKFAGAALNPTMFLGTAASMGDTLLAGKQNEKLQNRANDINVIEAKRNRDWQEMMSNTSHQREVKDLKEAGLNPLLSGTGGASTPGGSSASASASTYEGGSLTRGITSAIEMNAMKLANAKAEKELGLMEAQTNKTKTESKVLEKGIPEAEAKNEMWNTIKPIFKKMNEAVRGVSAPKHKNDPVFEENRKNLLNRVKLNHR